ncbi:MAG: valine--tRNA ligase [Pseudomonadota bacterium]|nr:valine--tRNA ligase [Pseudomonadota bacterium]
MLDKTYLPTDIESKIYRAWEAAGHFACAPKSGAAPYCVMMPPPNVTGSLHMGHALNSTLQDVLTRYRRKKGRDALWQPVMDHAGIATQMVVERQLGEENIHRRDLGRDEFVARVWRWKEESGGAIANQLRRLGASPDWSRDRFTMDEGLSNAVRTVFVALYEEGLIYRDKRLVNWDPKFHTAISDLEVEPRESDGSLWHFRYPIEGRDGEFIIVATTRPETMLGDTAVAVHPDDARWQNLIGGHAILPLVGRRLIVVADDYADPEQGSGAVKITPAHDFNDFEVARRHDLELINIFDADASLNDNVPEAYRGLDRYAARKKVVADMEALGLVEKIEPHRHALPHGDRSSVVVEPWLTDQWFADAKTLAIPAIEAVETGRIKFVPKQWENTYFEWMRNIQPWCISRQLWWGHRIPAWYGPDQKIFVAMDEAAAHEQATAHYGEAVALTQDADVLDTWFSSGLWPFSTLGWPEKTEALETYYPNDDLITGFDIIFFWVARMIMLGMHFMGDVPFRTVYIHALVRDAEGQKMSKSKGNVIDPLELIDSYGADAMRFTLAAMEAQGRDIKLSESRVEGYRNFATKLWNAARFCEANACTRDPAYDPAACTGTVNRWIVGEAARAAGTINTALEAYHFNEAANAIYQFAWGVFCDWFVEFSKPVLNGPDGAEKDETRGTAAWVLEQILGLLHPFMPFVTEELWGRLDENRTQPLITTAWPDLNDSALQYEAASAEIDRVIALVSGVRAARAEMNVPAGAKIPLLLRGENGFPDWAENQREQIVQLARLDGMAALDGAPPKGSVQLVIEGHSVALPLAGVIDVEQERARLDKELARIAQEIAKIEAKLGNDKFLAKAPEHVVAEQRRRKSESEAAHVKISEAAKRIDAL